MAQASLVLVVFPNRCERHTLSTAPSPIYPSPALTATRPVSNVTRVGAMWGRPQLVSPATMIQLFTPGCSS